MNVRTYLPARTLRAALVLLSCMLGACSTLPERGQVMMRDVSFPLRDFRMPSGLRVVVEEDRRSPVVAVVAVVGVGGSSDPRGKEGLAHLVEHLAYRARHEGGPSVWTRLEQEGAGGVHAFTGLDHMAFQTLAPKEALPALLKVEGQRLAAPLAGVSPEVFAVEREVVRNELREKNETGYVGQVFSWLSAETFPADHPYSRPVIGTHESLSSLTVGDAQRFARTHYRPENVTLVISGDVDLAAMEGVLHQNLPASWVGTGAPLALEPRLSAKPPETVTKPRAKEMPVYEAAVASPELYMAWALPRGFDEASAIHQFAQSVFFPYLMGAGRHDGDISGFSTHLISGTRASMLAVRVVLHKGDDPERSAGRVMDQFYRAWNLAVDPANLKWRDMDIHAMRRTVVTGMALEAEDLLARATRRAELTHFLQDSRAYNRSQQALAALGGGDVTDFGYQWLNRERVRVILVRPGETGTAAVQGVGSPLSDDEGPTPATARLVPAANAAVATPVQVLKLDNGMEVLLSPRPGLPVVHVGVALAGGRVSEPKPGVAELADWGAYRESTFEGFPGHWGLHPSWWLANDQLRYRLSGTSGNVGNILAVLAEQLDSMRTNEYVVMGFQEHVLPWRRAVDQRPEVLAQRQLLHALYGDQAYGHEATGDDLEDVSWREANAWLEEVHRPANAVVAITGEFDVKEVEPLVRRYLGGWRRGKPTAVEPPSVQPLPAASPLPKSFLTPRPGATAGLAVRG
ncbi:M16 family metallopeptidase, partial [Pyxidicoccus sp. 3LFB2]